MTGLNNTDSQALVIGWIMTKSIENVTLLYVLTSEAKKAV